MTATNPASRQIHEFDLALDRQAEQLHHALLDGTYNDGMEHRLADDAIAPLEPPARLHHAIWHLVHDNVMDLVLTLCLLDETATNTYDLIGTITDTVLAAIHAEGHEEGVLHRLTVAEIDERQQLRARLAKYDLDGVA